MLPIPTQAPLSVRKTANVLGLPLPCLPKTLLGVKKQPCFSRTLKLSLIVLNLKRKTGNCFISYISFQLLKIL